MLRIHCYPVMNGLEIEFSGSCVREEGQHAGHRGSSVWRYIDAEELDKRGLEGAIAAEVTLALHEFSEVADRASC